MANLKPIKEALKEAGRIVALGVIAYILTEGVIDFAVERVAGTYLDAVTKTYIIGGITAGLRSLDKWLHELGKEIENKTLSGGITRF